MRHTNLQNMFDELLEGPDEILVHANSGHHALYGKGDEDMILLKGDFSGTDEESEAEARRLLNGAKTS